LTAPSRSPECASSTTSAGTESDANSNGTPSFSDNSATCASRRWKRSKTSWMYAVT
jgi:hypothetical protein